MSMQEKQMRSKILSLSNTMMSHLQTCEDQLTFWEPANHHIPSVAARHNLIFCLFLTICSNLINHPPVAWELIEKIYFFCQTLSKRTVAGCHCDKKIN